MEERSSTTGLQLLLAEAGGSGNQGRHAKGGMRANPAWPGLAKDMKASNKGHGYLHKHTPEPTLLLTEYDVKRQAAP